MALASTLAWGRARMACATLLIVACGSAKGDRDGSVRDGGGVDAFALDAGPQDAAFADSGSRDAESFDVDARDSGPSGAAVDATMADDAFVLDAGGCGPGGLADAIADEPADECGACGERGGPIGGGEGYPRAVSRGSGTLVVADAEALVAALASASCGDVVYVDDEAVIDLTGMGGMFGIAIPAGVTLASGRGVAGSLGGLIRTTERTVAPLFVAAEGTRVTGLRIEGAQQDPGERGDSTPASVGIQAFAVSHLEVDNCEIYGWGFAAIGLSNSRGHVHHCSIHHNWRLSVGYGIVVSGGSYALVESNRFDANRHSIASNGDRRVRYEARFNVVGAMANGHAFDVHGEDEDEPDSSGLAGDEIRIHHNTFLLTDRRAVLVRGIPVTGAWITRNSVAHADEASAFAQSRFIGNVHIELNCPMRTTADCP